MRRAFVYLFTALLTGTAIAQSGSVEFPKDGETVVIGKPYPIRWTSSASGSVTLMLQESTGSTNTASGGVISAIRMITPPIGELEENTGAFSWTPGSDLEPNGDGPGYYMISISIEGQSLSLTSGKFKLVRASNGVPSGGGSSGDDKGSDSSGGGTPTDTGSNGGSATSSPPAPNEETKTSKLEEKKSSPTSKANSNDEEKSPSDASETSSSDSSASSGTAADGSDTSPSGTSSEGDSSGSDQGTSTDGTPEPSTTSSGSKFPPSSTSKSPPLAAIIGGVLGAVIIILLILFIIIGKKRQWFGGSVKQEEEPTIPLPYENAAFAKDTDKTPEVGYSEEPSIENTAITPYAAQMRRQQGVTENAAVHNYAELHGNSTNQHYAELHGNTPVENMQGNMGNNVYETTALEGQRNAPIVQYAELQGSGITETVQGYEGGRTVQETTFNGYPMATTQETWDPSNNYQTGGGASETVANGATGRMETMVGTLEDARTRDTR